MMVKIQQRRPIKARHSHWAQVAARYLQRLGITPNTISIVSVLCAGVSGICFFLAFSFSTTLLLLLAALCIQLRLICNLLDGMVAIEGGKRTPGGAVYNDLPDRIADSLILVGLGYGLSAFMFAPALGWLAALLAVMTAYIRVLGGNCGVSQPFLGPMAKQQRMALLTVSAIIAALLPLNHAQWAMLIALLSIVMGSLWTCIRRTRKILADLAQGTDHA